MGKMGNQQNERQTGGAGVTRQEGRGVAGGSAGADVNSEQMLRGYLVAWKISSLSTARR